MHGTSEDQPVFQPEPRMIEFQLPLGPANSMLLMALTGAERELDSVLAFHERGPDTNTIMGLRIAQQTIGNMIDTIHEANASVQDEYMAFMENAQRGGLHVHQADANKLGTDE